LQKILTHQILCEEAKIFSEMQSNIEEVSLFGITDGKAIGTYIEHKFQNYLEEKFLKEVILLKVLIFQN